MAAVGQAVRGDGAGAGRGGGAVGRAAGLVSLQGVGGHWAPMTLRAMRPADNTLHSQPAV